MRKWFKPLLWMVISLFILIFSSLSLFIYKVKFGLPFYETTPPELQLNESDFNVLIFSKTNGFNHSSAIEASKPFFERLGKKNNWQLYFTDEAGVFNDEQLALFDVVVWNNTSGKVLKEFQRTSFKQYIENGGSFLGIHAAGDDSHHWKWYYDHLIATTFSHHPIENQLQASTLHLQEKVDSTWTFNLPKEINHTDEWYIFNTNPEEKGAQVVFAMDGTTIDTNGNFLWIKNKEHGMGKYHPLIWYKNVEKGKAVYSALGHTAETYQNEEYCKVIEKAITWLGSKKN